MYSVYKMLPEPDSISCFLCIFLSNHETGKLLSAIAFVVPSPHIHIQYKNTCRSNSQQDKSVQSFLRHCLTGLQLQTTLLRVSRILCNKPDSSPMLHSLHYMCVYVSSHTASQAQETVVSLNNTLPLSPAVLLNKQVSVCQTRTRLQFTLGQRSTESPSGAYVHVA